MDVKYEKILAEVSKLYIRYGIKSVTMDDVAQTLGISKKTLYNFVENKEDLVGKVVNFHIHNNCVKYDVISKKDLNAIDILWEVSHHVIELLSSFTMLVHQDLLKYYPSILNVLTEHRNKHIYANILENINQGINEGYYRSDLKPEIVSQIYVSRIEIMFNEGLFPIDKFTLSEVFQEMFKYHIYGICNKMGIEYYEKKMSKNV